MKIKMYFKRETVHKVVFDENVEDRDKRLGKLYITKTCYAGMNEPKVIEVEINPLKNY